MGEIITRSGGTKTIYTADEYTLVQQSLASLNTNKADKTDIPDLTGINAQLADIAKDISLFPVISPELDDTGRLQRAFQSGYHIILEKGATYNVTSLSFTTSDFVLFGNNATIKTTANNVHGFLIGYQSKNILIRDLNFQGMADGTADSVAIDILVSGSDAVRGSSANNIEISHCNFLGGFSVSIEANSTTGLKIHDCTGGGNYYIPSAATGGYFILLQSCYDVEIYNNKAVGATNDRHAVYVSCNGSLTTDPANENVFVHHNIFDWTLVNAGTNHETVIPCRTTRNLHIHDNKTFGGWGGIGIEPSHGDLINANIHDNQVIDVKSYADADLFGIAVAKQDKGGSYKVYNAKIHNNQVTVKDGIRTHAYQIIDTIGFELQDNLGSYAGSGAFGVNIVDSSDGVIEGNHFNGNGTGRNGIGYSNACDDIVVGFNKILGTTYKEELIGSQTTLTNVRHTYERSFSISTNGTGTITVSDDTDNLVQSVVSASYGCDITFKPVWDVKQGTLEVVSMSGPSMTYQNRGTNATTNVFNLTLWNSSTLSNLPLATSVVSFRVILRS